MWVESEVVEFWSFDLFYSLGGRMRWHKLQSSWHFFSSVSFQTYRQPVDLARILLSCSPSPSRISRSRRSNRDTWCWTLTIQARLCVTVTHAHTVAFRIHKCNYEPKRMTAFWINKHKSCATHKSNKQNFGNKEIMHVCCWCWCWRCLVFMVA